MQMHISVPQSCIPNLVTVFHIMQISKKSIMVAFYWGFFVKHIEL